MSLFDDSEDSEQWYYDPQNDFEKQVLRHAAERDEHPLAYLARKQEEAIDAMEHFVEQDTHLSKADRIAIFSDTEEAKDAMIRACQVIPSSAVGTDD